jgi:membrane protease YdiL (CAAX protease family)
MRKPFLPVCCWPLFVVSWDHCCSKLANKIGSSRLLATSGDHLIQGGKSTFLLFAVFTVPSMIFSPIGEEFFFRALLQRSLEDFTSRSLATVCECSVFAIVHLCHHGLYRTSMGFSFWMPSSIIWAALMFLAGYLFAYFRNTSDSIFPAVVCHMAFNATMGVYIFSVLWGAHHAA